MSLYVRTGGAWAAPSAVRVRSGGAWVTPTATYVRTGGAWVPVTSEGPPPVTLLPPTNATVTLFNINRYRIAWTITTPTATSRIYRRVNGGAWSIVKNVAVGIDSFDSAYTSGQFGVSHVLGTQESALNIASGPPNPDV